MCGVDGLNRTWSQRATTNDKYLIKLFFIICLFLFVHVLPNIFHLG